jgi:hypothetical protein
MANLFIVLKLLLRFNRLKLQQKICPYVENIYTVVLKYLQSIQPYKILVKWLGLNDFQPV